LPTKGLELKRDDKTIGHVTSASYSPTLHASVALGYVRREVSSVGSQLESAVGPVEVIGIPMI
jgi:glycine cleavage system aminomethyltransferase T